MSGQQVNASRLEWQIASGSTMAHVLVADAPVKRRGERGWQSGPRAVCGRYPQRNLESPWFSYPVGPDADRALRGYMAQQCEGCLGAITTPPAQSDSLPDSQR